MFRNFLLLLHDILKNYAHIGLVCDTKRIYYLG